MHQIKDFYLTAREILFDGRELMPIIDMSEAKTALEREHRIEDLIELIKIIKTERKCKAQRASLQSCEDELKQLRKEAKEHAS